MTAFANILVPIDYEAAADVALRVAGNLARAGKGKLLVAHMLPLPVYTMTEVPLGAIDRRWIADETTRLRTHVRTVLETDGDVPPFDVDVVVDAPVLRTIQLAAERRIDLIVMGTHGRKGLRHLMLGSVAAKIVRLAPCPVLTMHAEVEPPLGLLAAAAHREAKSAPDDGADLVGDLMCRTPVTIVSDAVLEDARALMATHGVRHLPVVDRGTLVGMLSSSDLGRHVGHLERTKVNAAMTTEAIAVPPTETAAAAARLMLARGVRALPVVDDRGVVGVLSASDIVEDYALAARA